MLHDPEFMKQATEALRNPVHVRDVLRSTDRSMAHLEEKLLGGGFDVLRSLCEDIDRPKQDEAWNREQEKLKELAKASKAKGKKKKNGDDGEDEGDDMEDEGEPLEEDLGKPVPEWSGTFDTNAMASMMQDQNMQQLLAQMVQSLPGPTQKPHPDDPFIDPGFLGQMFHSQTIQSISFLQDAVGKLSLAPEPADGAAPKAKKKAGKATAKGKAAPEGKDEEEQPLQDSPAVLSGLNTASPAANPKESFSLFLQAELESPEVRYKGQLSAMANMGFTDKEACIQALHSHDGNMNKAVESLMQAQK